MSKTESRKLSDDYEVVDVLGRGGFSIVRRGVSKSEEKTQVAIKTLRRLGPAMAGMKQGTKPVPGSGLPMWKQVSISDALLTNEILVMRRIVESVAPHPNVINLHDVYEDVHGVHLVLELCSGGELFDRIVGRDRYSEFDAACVIRQIASGLEALHKASIVHRDLKPENCLFSDKDEKSTLKIMDFGLSSVEDFSDPIVALFGSIDYVSPEALSRQEVSAASDMWSVGVILYILLSGYVGHFLVIVPLIRIIFVVLSLVVCVFQMPTISCCNQSRKAAKDPAR
jgi:calcium-dependent protein kinase